MCGFFGDLIGRGLGGALGGALGNQGAGSSIGGSILGNLIPFGRGGFIPPSMASVPFYQRGGKVKKGKKSHPPSGGKPPLHGRKVKKNKKSSK
jgi:hypothetical protein